MPLTLRQLCFVSVIRAAILMLLLLVYGLAATPTQADNHIIFVNNTAKGANNGTSWANAYVNLQTALTAAQAGNEIWVAASSYIPGPTASSTFQLKNGVALYGGFAGNESNLDQRNISLNPTILSGYVSSVTRAYHVVLASGVDSSAILDGFTIIMGSAYGASQFPCFQQCGGGIYMNNGSPTLVNLKIYLNQAIYGGGMYVYNNSNPLLTNVSFVENYADANGGGIQIDTSVPVLKNVSFLKNTAKLYGGAMLNNVASPILLDAVFRENRAFESGGGLYNLADSNPTLNRVLFHGNLASTNGGAIVNENSSPTLINVVMSGNVAEYNGGAVFHTGDSSGTWSHLSMSCSRGNLLDDHISVAGSSTLFLNNSIIWTVGDNKSQVIHRSDSAVITVTHSLIHKFGGSGAGWHDSISVDGGGNLDSPTSPFLVDCDDGGDGFGGLGNNNYGDFSLKSSAPAVDAGNNNLIPPDDQDLDDDGNTTEPLSWALFDLPRVAAVKKVPATVDMGAYEYVNILPIAYMSGPHLLNEGDSIALDASTSTDDIGIVNYAWDCTNDGSVDLNAAAPTGDSCDYPDDGNFALRLTVTDGGGATAITTTVVTVNNVAPLWTAPPNQSTVAGAVKTFDLGNFTDPGADAPWVVTVDWGDTNTPTSINAVLPGELATEYVYAGAGAYNVVVRVDDGSVEVAGGFQVIVNAPPPGAPKVVSPGAQTATVGVEKMFTLGSFTDADDLPPWQVKVDWGDDSADTVFEADATGNLISRAHNYGAAGIFTVVITVNDGELAGNASFQVTVAGAPTATEHVFIPAVTR